MATEAELEKRLDAAITEFDKRMATEAELEKRLDAAITEFDKRIVALGERVVALEGITPMMPRDIAPYNNRIELLENAAEELRAAYDALSQKPTGDANGDLREVVSALHERIMGVPLGAVQKLDD